MTSTRFAAQQKPLNERLQHLTPNERAGLATFVNRLREHYGNQLRRVVLFGSKARSDYSDESDLDLLVTMRMANGDYWQYWNEIVGIAWEVELAYGVVTSLIIKDEGDYAAMREHQLLLARNIERDGIELWTAQPNALTFESA